MSGILYIVATPIGHLEDITLRALNVLKEVDFVAAEDTRRTLPLLTHFGIQKKVLSYFEYSKQKRQDQILNLLEEGENGALLCDAGTPTLSDPGARLIGQCWGRGISVVPIPGPSALLSALAVAGMPTEPLHFWGFLPPTRSKREKIYAWIEELEGTHALYESCHRIVKRVTEWEGRFAGFHLFVGREMTKKFEQFWRGTVTEVAPAMRSAEHRGEFTVLFSRKIFP